MNLQERLKLVMQNSGLTIPKFAKKIGVSRNTLISYRDGRTSPNYGFLMKICGEFSINPGWLFLGEGPMRPGETVIDPAVGSPPPPDLDLLRQVLAGVEQGLARLDLTLAPGKKADLVILLYDHFAKTGDSPEEQIVERYLRLVA